MERLGVGKDIFVVSGKITEFGERLSDPDVGDFYKHILVDDTPLKSVIIPHSLKNYISGDAEQKLYFTKFRSSYFLVGVDSEDYKKVAKPLDAKITKSSLAVVFFGLIASFLSMQAGFYPHAEIFIVFAFVLLLFVVFVFINKNTVYFLGKKVDGNLPLLKAKLATN